MTTTMMPEEQLQRAIAYLNAVPVGEGRFAYCTPTEGYFRTFSGVANISVNAEGQTEGLRTAGGAIMPLWWKPDQRFAFKLEREGYSTLYLYAIEPKDPNVRAYIAVTASVVTGKELRTRNVRCACPYCKCDARAVIAERDPGQPVGRPDPADAARCENCEIGFRAYFRHDDCPKQPGVTWTSEWCSACNDSCPACDREIEPYRYEVIGEAE